MATFTKIIHRKPYPAIEPASPANSQAGKTILITGAASGIGIEIARAFIKASAIRVILVSRRLDTLTNAVADLESSKPENSSTIILSRCCNFSHDSDLQVSIIKEQKLPILDSFPSEDG
jgi:FlaA1/EpsC-like NDP-sugar epimerase